MLSPVQSRRHIIAYRNENLDENSENSENITPNNSNKISRLSNTNILKSDIQIHIPHIPGSNSPMQRRRKEISEEDQQASCLMLPLQEDKPEQTVTNPLHIVSTSSTELETEEIVSGNCTHPDYSTSLEQEVKELRAAVEFLYQYHAHEEKGRKFDSSWARVLVIMGITYVTLSSYMRLIGVEEPLRGAVVPTVGFYLSTWSLSFMRALWVRWYDWNWGRGDKRSTALFRKNCDCLV